MWSAAYGQCTNKFSVNAPDVQVLWIWKVMPNVSLWRRAYARNVRLYYSYRQYTNLFLKAPCTRPSFPWQVLFARVHSISWQVFPSQEALVMPAFEQGKLFVCTENLSIQANLRTSSSRKTCPAAHMSKQNLSRKSCGKKTCSLYTHEQVKLPRNLSRKTCSCVRAGLKDKSGHALRACIIVFIRIHTEVYNK